MHLRFSAAEDLNLGLRKSHDIQLNIFGLLEIKDKIMCTELAE